MHDAVAIGCQAVVVRPARCRLVHDTGSGAWTVHGRILRQYVRCFVLDISYAFTDFLSSRKKMRIFTIMITYYLMAIFYNSSMTHFMPCVNR